MTCTASPRARSSGWAACWCRMPGGSRDIATPMSRCMRSPMRCSAPSARVISACISASDPQWRGQRSAKFLEHAAALVAATGGVIDFVDLTIICEAPKVGHAPRGDPREHRRHIGAATVRSEREGDHHRAAGLHRARRRHGRAGDRHGAGAGALKFLPGQAGGDGQVAKRSHPVKELTRVGNNRVAKARAYGHDSPAGAGCRRAQGA